ncbi:hypothetical protein BKA58DRAFT_450402 [Alternaria rosae]|uniref:uncharacterized protein n=1 Tax=Alternaria rosae TaxID=1187941 RepID=UPI001E8E73CB|nr:uncharacterized protein BKA58DRAFT_450402 [Alternaria rosae]KAH6853055.1 hypothetical protein BKA58DRAFT_450402 [Alternaria rosae]
MSFLQNLFSSPATSSLAKKRNVLDTPSSRSGEKRKRDAYDPEQYQNAVYAGAGTARVNGDDVFVLDEEEAAAHQLQAEAEVEIEDDDEDDDARPYVTPKSVRKLSRDLYTAIEARGSGSRADRTEKHGEAERALAGTSTRVTVSPSICTGSETDNEEDEVNDDMDWPSDDDLHLSFSPTTSSANPVMTSTNAIITPEQKCSTKPNLRARELSSNPKSIRAESPSEPEYAFRDAEIRDGLCHLTTSIEDFSKEHFPSGAHTSFTFKDKNGDVMMHNKFFKSLTLETAKLINCVASGGPSGLWGWHNLFVDIEKLQALVCGVIGNVLSFDCNARYAATIRAHLPAPTFLPKNFNGHVTPSSEHYGDPPTLSSIFKPLRRLTTSAALLSLHMHLDPHTAYHHVPLFKEDNYDSSVMECYNDASMRQRNMHNKYAEVEGEEQKRRDTLSGWEVGSSDVSGEGGPVYGKREYKNMGIRVRVLTQGLVYCRWGRALSMQKAALMDNETEKKIHGDAWREGGFMQFTDVEGVFDWLGKERREKAEAREAFIQRIAERASASGTGTGAVEKTHEIREEPEKIKRKGKGKVREEIEDSDPDR